MPDAYPLTIRSILRAGKSRTQPAAFTMAEPRRGFGYSQATGTDVPVFWDVVFRFTEQEAQVFWTWFRFIIANGVDEFTMPIRTEFGVIEHTCRFLPDSLLPVKEEGQLFSYSATIMARELQVPDGVEEAAELIVALPDWWTWSQLLDQTVTVEMPGA
jgi:hypothetical protein